MLNVSPLNKALAALKRSLDQPENEFIRNSTIQCFEFSYELSWKYTKRLLQQNFNLKDQSAKGIWREAAKNQLINNVENWFEYHKARNLTSYTYNEPTSIHVYTQARKFYTDALELLARIEQIIA